MIRKLLFTLGLTCIVLFNCPVNATPKFLVLCTTTCTWDNTNDAIWSLSSGGLNNTTHPVAGDTATLDASSCTGGTTCTITGGAVTLTMTSITMGACTATTAGCILDFSANNTVVTLSTSWSNTGTGTRTFKPGTGQWTITGTGGTIWNQLTTTNCTCDMSGINLLFNGVGIATQSRTFSMGTSLTYGTVAVTPTSASATPFTFSGVTTTITNLTLTSTQQMIDMSIAALTITTLNLPTATAAAPVYIGSNTGRATLTVGNAASGQYIFIQSIQRAGAGSIALTNSYDGGGNNLTASYTISNPSSGGGKIIGG